MPRSLKSIEVDEDFLPDDDSIDHLEFLEKTTGNSFYPENFEGLATTAQKIALDMFIKSAAILSYRLDLEMAGNTSAYEKSITAYKAASAVLSEVTGLDQYCDLNAALQKVISAGYETTKKA